MYPFSRTLLLLCLIAATVATAQTAKHYQNPAEYRIYDAVTKDLSANDFAKALSDLDTWQKTYPTSDYRDDRQLLYVQSYAAAKQPAKTIDAATDLLARQDLEVAVGGPANVVKLLFTTATAVQQLPSPTPQEMATAGKAARQLLAYDKKPETLTDEAWTQVRTQLQTAAKASLLFIALLPGTQAMQKNDCAAAETAFTRAIEDNPDSSDVAYSLGRADLCLYKTQPEKASAAIYEFARAVALDPRQATIAAYLEKVFEQYHGKDPDGLRQLKDLAAKSPSPPAGFHIKSVTEIADEKQAEFEKSNPQLALWMRIKGALADTNGEQYFASSLQGTEVQGLRGMLVEAKPPCRPKELFVAVPLPDAQQPLQAEIVLKLDKPLPGKPEPNAEFHWTGAPVAFNKTPFLLTMETETAKIEELKTTPCAAPVRKSPHR
jgi:tetratricopeptide (TPR) repeat protein